MSREIILDSLCDVCEEWFEEDELFRLEVGNVIQEHVCIGCIEDYEQRLKEALESAEADFMDEWLSWLP